MNNKCILMGKTSIPHCLHVYYTCIIAIPEYPVTSKTFLNTIQCMKNAEHIFNKSKVTERDQYLQPSSL